MDAFLEEVLHRKFGFEGRYGLDGDFPILPRDSVNVTQSPAQALQLHTFKIIHPSLVTQVLKQK
jgi:hypothetical protein